MTPEIKSGDTDKDFAGFFSKKNYQAFWCSYKILIAKVNTMGACLLLLFLAVFMANREEILQLSVFEIYVWNTMYMTAIRVIIPSHSV